MTSLAALGRQRDQISQSLKVQRSLISLIETQGDGAAEKSIFECWAGLQRLASELSDDFTPKVDKIYSKRDQKDPVTNAARYGDAARAKIETLQSDAASLRGEVEGARAALQAAAAAAMQCSLDEAQQQLQQRGGASCGVGGPQSTASAAAVPDVVAPINSVDKNREYHQVLSAFAFTETVKADYEKAKLRGKASEEQQSTIAAADGAGASAAAAAAASGAAVAGAAVDSELHQRAQAAREQKAIAAAAQRAFQQQVLVNFTSPFLSYTFIDAFHQWHSSH